MAVTPEKKEELVRAAHIIAYEGYYHSQDRAHGETNAMFRTIIYLLSKVLEKDKHYLTIDNNK